jgi:hypothetical protein
MSSSFRILFIAIAFAPGLSSAEGALNNKSARVRPNVVMAADPEPPFTYWVPRYSTVRNHPRQPGIWIADFKDGSRKYYFGDQCRASEYQHFIGRRIDVLPEKPANAIWRLACSTCPRISDVDWTRMNVSYDQETKKINDISCG